jgi:nucleotide-binding universal stress UspA family protein
MYRQVVVPLDGSELAEGILPYVTEVIGNRSGQVHLLSIAPAPKGITSTVRTTSSSPPNPQEEGQDTGRESEMYLSAVATRLEHVAGDVRASVRFGQPADEILAFASDVGADLIAMSTHGRSGISRWVFGSVADRVLRGATCPVLLVRAGQEPVLPLYRRIVVPLDGSELAEQVVPYVKGLVRPFHTRIFLVSVLTTGLADRTVTLLTSYPPGLQLATTALDHAEAQIQAYLRSVAAALREQVAAVHIAIRRGSPADEILTYVDEVEADLISMTTHGFSGSSQWVYGNVAGRVLQGARCPVLLVRPSFQ